MKMRALVLLAGLSFGIAGHAQEATLHATTEEPRAYGYQVGDLLQRRVTVHVPPGLQLTLDALPRPLAPGMPIELRALRWQRADEGRGSRYEFLLEYQVFFSPPEARTLELPPIVLPFTGTPRAQDLRIEAWPVTVAPLVPVEVSPRRGLGEMQADVEPLAIDTSGMLRRLAAYALAGFVPALYLGHVYGVLPWWARRHRPFDAAWRQIKALPAAPDAERYREACRQLHAALDQIAGTVLFEQGLDDFIQRRPRFGVVRDDLVRFFRRSRLAFFAAPAAPDAADARELVALCRRCRDIDRGAA